MYGITHNIPDVVKQLRALPFVIGIYADQALDSELRALQTRMEGKTPVVTEQMRRRYDVVRLGLGSFDLVDYAWRPGRDGGRFYPPWVIWGTRRNRDNPALRMELDVNAERDLTNAVDRVIRQIVASYNP